MNFLKSPQSTPAPVATTAPAPTSKKAEKPATAKAAPDSISITRPLEPAAIERAKAYTLAKQTIPHSFAGSSIRFKKQPANLAQSLVRSAFGALLQVRGRRNSVGFVLFLEWVFFFVSLSSPQVPTLRQEGPILVQLQEGVATTVLGLEDVERMAEPGFTGRTDSATFSVVMNAQVVSMAEVVVPGQVQLS